MTKFHCIWLYTPSRGWGYTFRVPAFIVGSGYARTKIVAMTESGKLKTRYVKAEHLVDPKSDSEAAKCLQIEQLLGSSSGAAIMAAVPSDAAGSGRRAKRYVGSIPAPGVPSQPRSAAPDSHGGHKR